MMDLNKYIDSSVMIENGPHICYTPAEQAIIIILSHRCTIGEKIHDLQELVDNYEDTEFVLSKNLYNYTENKEWSIRRDIEAILKLWKELLNDRYNNTGAIFLADLQEKGRECDRLSAYRFFSTYENAMEFLRKEKDSYLALDDLKEIVTYGEIWRMEVDTDNPDCDVYFFDDQMRLVDIICCSDRAGKSALNAFTCMEDIYIREFGQEKNMEKSQEAEEPLETFQVDEFIFCKLMIVGKVRIAKNVFI